MTWIKRDVVMLPTNEKVNTPFYCSSDGLHLKKQYNGNSYVPQHLYILSDEEIKEGDWCIMLDSYGNVFSSPQQYVDPKTQFINKGHRKIIATTDKSLVSEYCCIKSEGLIAMNAACRERNRCLLPQIPQSFIEHYISEYNKSNTITDVMVEYDEKETGKNTFVFTCGHEDNGFHSGDECYCGCSDIRKVPVVEYSLKVNPKDNTISIRKIKDSWSRDEVIGLIEKFSYENCLNAFQNNEKWIEENL